MIGIIKKGINEDKILWVIKLPKDNQNLKNIVLKKELNKK